MSHTSVRIPCLFLPPDTKRWPAESEPNRQVCILTSGIIIYAWVEKLRLHWDAPFSDIGTVSLDENGIRVLDRKKREMGFIIITERHDREWFYGQISKYVISSPLICPDIERFAGSLPRTMPPNDSSPHDPYASLLHRKEDLLQSSLNIVSK
jgi:hypothetical protein